MPNEIKKYPEYPMGLIATLIAVNIFLSVISSANFAGIIIGAAALSAASALFACLIIMTRSMNIFFICVPGFIISMIVSGGVVYAFLGLAYIPLGFILSLGMKRRLPRTEIIVRLSATIIILYTAAFIIAFISSGGGFSMQSIKDIINKEASDVIDYYNELLISRGGADTLPIMSEETKGEFVSSLKALVPAFFVIYCNAVSFFITFIFRLMYNSLIAAAYMKENRKKNLALKKTEWRITISFISAVVYVVCVFFTMFFSSPDTIWIVIVMTNILYILIPGLFIVGFYLVHEKIKLLCRNNSFTVVLIFVFIGIIFILFSSLVIMTFAFCGVYSIQAAEMKKLAEKIKNSFSNSGRGED